MLAKLVSWRCEVKISFTGSGAGDNRFEKVKRTFFFLGIHVGRGGN